ncbi:MAG: 2-hydroxyacyl-CoA dehydratase, partial [Lachnospiraceae bacterium]|nr:2-hydroxyacyl-CoA dehydratase [Lachnospiraceae bacterium]
FFKELAFKVVLSPRSSRKVYDLGIESIPSESACYPAKITHGHIEWLISKGVDFIFYPCIPYERNEFKDSNNHYNCPVVTSYAENIKNNVDAITRGDVRFLNPFMAFSSEKVLTAQLIKVFKKEFPDITEAEVKKASHLAWTELETYRRDVSKKGEETIEWLKKTGNHGIVICGRPYHIDPEINHGIPELITGFGMAVLTEDSVSHLGNIERPLIVLDQWMYHTRMYAAAEYVSRHDFLDVVELNSFGCGVDAVATDAVSDIITHSGKIYTCLKIDEVNNLGAARIRIRSLIAALKVRAKLQKKPEKTPSSYNRAVFTKEMKKNFTILAPEMSPIHFDVVAPAFHAAGYNLVIPDIPRNDCIDYGLKYVNNDACYPSLMIVGQFMAAIDSGKYDMNNTALLITQTGGGCRASNYVGFIRRALNKAGYGDRIPVVSLNTLGIEKNPGFSISPALIQHGLYALIFGDIFMRCVNRIRPYEKEKGSTNALHEKWKEKVLSFVTSDGVLSAKKFKEMCRDIINDFDNLPITDEKKPRVGIVGEILVKFLPAANNHLSELLEAEGAEAVVPDLTDFLLYCFYNENFKNENLGTPKKSRIMSNAIIAFFEHLRGAARKAFNESKRFSAPARIDEVAELARPIVSIGNQTGEGWFLTGEMMELIETGAKNIVCIQPFGCLPNHVVGKGVLKKIRADHPDANLVAIDYDPGASEVNQLNRIKLMLSTAFKNL